MKAPHFPRAQSSLGYRCNQKYAAQKSGRLPMTGRPLFLHAYRLRLRYSGLGLGSRIFAVQDAVVRSRLHPANEFLYAVYRHRVSELPAP